MAYELFQNKAARFSAPQLTIRNGRLFFNADGGDLWDKHGAAFAHLLWDAKAYKLGVRPASTEDDNTFRVSTPKGKRGKTIAAVSFLKYIRWDNHRPTVADVRWNEAAGIFEVLLPHQHLKAKG